MRGATLFSWKSAVWALVAMGCGWIAIIFHNYLPTIIGIPASSNVPYFISIDDESYEKMMEHKTAQVVSPFSKRILYPSIVRTVSNATGWSLSRSCLIFNCFAWALLSMCLAELLRWLTGASWLLLPLLFTPFPLSMLFSGYMPELFHMALVAMMFLLLLTDRTALAMVMLFLAFLTRESTLLLCLVIMVVAWVQNRRSMAACSGGVLLLGMACGAWFARQGLPNIYHLPDFLYLFFKVIYNGLRDYLGIMLWTNVDMGRSVPTFVWTLPRSLQWGIVRQVGVCLTLAPLLQGWLSLATVFSFAPLALWRGRALVRSLQTWPLAVQVAFFYGLIAFFIGPALGAAMERLVGAAWPLFWIVLPYMIARYAIRWPPRKVVGLIVLYLVLAWTPQFTGYGEKWPQCLWWLAIVLMYALAAWQWPMPLEKMVNNETSGSIVKTKFSPS